MINWVQLSNGIKCTCNSCSESFLLFSRLFFLGLLLLGVIAGYNGSVFKAKLMLLQGFVIKILWLLFLDVLLPTLLLLLLVSSLLLFLHLHVSFEQSLNVFSLVICMFDQLFCMCLHHHSLLVLNRVFIFTNSKLLNVQQVLTLHAP